jgi:hypothetical protein
LEISKAEIEAVKSAHDLVDVVASDGIKVKKKGSNLPRSLRLSLCDKSAPIWSL